jgi:hypothetical protein
LRPVSFLVLHTSPGNFQTWLAVSDADADFARRLRRGAGADLGASGASRMAGSLNCKDKYAPAFPRVETVHTNPGHLVTRGAGGLRHRSTCRIVLVHSAPGPCFPLFFTQELAQLSTLPGERPACPRRRRSRCQPSRLHLVPNRPRLGLWHRGDRRPPHGQKPKSPGEWRGLRPSHDGGRSACVGTAAGEAALSTSSAAPQEGPTTARTGGRPTRKVNASAHTKKGRSGLQKCSTFRTRRNSRLVKNYEA